MSLGYFKRNYQKIIKVGPSAAITLDHDFMKRQNWGIGDYVNVSYEANEVKINSTKSNTVAKKGKK